MSDLRVQLEQIIGGPIQRRIALEAARVTLDAVEAKLNTSGYVLTNASVSHLIDALRLSLSAPIQETKTDVPACGHCGKTPYHASDCPHDGEPWPQPLSAPTSKEQEHDVGSCPSSQSPVLAHVERSATDAPVAAKELAQRLKVMAVDALSHAGRPKRSRRDAQTLIAAADALSAPPEGAETLLSLRDLANMADQVTAISGVTGAEARAVIAEGAETPYEGRDTGARLRELRALLQEVWTEHADPRSGEYNTCDDGLCAWCEDTQRLIAALDAYVAEGAQTPAERPHDTPEEG